MGRNVRGAYPADWPAIAREVKVAAGWRCVRCGHPAERPATRFECRSSCDLVRHPEWRKVADVDADLPRYGHTLRWDEGVPFVRVDRPRQRVLTVAHLDDDKSNCRWWNLAALCQVCHLSTQSRIEMHRPWVLEPHSAWFQPYVAGYYAFRYLGEDLTREAVDARLDELLGLERRAAGLGAQ